MKVSIIIPVYNVESYIERCLLSALNQTYENIEIILVDDCGQDNSMEIAYQVINNHKKKAVVNVLKHKKNRGLSAARNTGINAATGEYVYFLDSDDELILHAIKTLVEEISDSDMVLGDILTSDRQKYANIKKGILQGQEIIDSYFRGDIYYMACNKLININFLLKNNLFFKEGLIHEDYLWTYQTIVCARKIKIIDLPTYIYYIRPNTLNTNFTLKNINHCLYSYDIIKTHIKNNYINNPLVSSYLITFIYAQSKASIIRCNCSYVEYSNLIKFDHTIKYNLSGTNIKIMYLFFQLPQRVQYFIIKYLYPLIKRQNKK